jgi:hypothetical protein
LLLLLQREEKERTSMMMNAWKLLVVLGAGLPLAASADYPVKRLRPQVDETKLAAERGDRAVYLGDVLINDQPHAAMDVQGLSGGWLAEGLRVGHLVEGPELPLALIVGVSRTGDEVELNPGGLVETTTLSHRVDTVFVPKGAR